MAVYFKTFINHVYQRLTPRYYYKLKTAKTRLDFHDLFSFRRIYPVILLLVLQGHYLAECSVSNSTTRLKHERNGRCK